MIDIIFESEFENTAAAENIILKAAQAALTHNGVFASVNITVTDEKRIHELNLQFRNVDRPTDVLSFPAWDGSQFDVTDGFLGDIAICMQVAMKQANQYGHSLERELAFLTVHGMLHIMGYDHITPTQEKEMFDMQEEILKEMGLER